MKSPVKSSYKPMLALSGDEELIDLSGFIFEPKLDGYRVLCIKNGGNLSILGRNGMNLSGDYPDVKNALLSIPHESFVLDGELIVYNSEGIVEFQPLESYKRSDLTVVFVAFDILLINGVDITKLPLKKRKKFLDVVINDNSSPNIQKIFYTMDGRTLFNSTYKSGLEGIVAKKSDSQYIVGERSRDWVKIKFLNTIDCVVVGFMRKKRNLSSLLLAVRNNSKSLIYIGRVGKGFTIAEENNIRRSLSKLRSNNALIKNLDRSGIPRKEMKSITWVSPIVVCEVSFSSLTDNGLLCNSTFLRIRTDKSADACTWQQFEKITD